MTIEKISEDKFVKVTLEDSGMEISMKYSRYSTLENRYKLIERFKEVLKKV